MIRQKKSALVVLTAIICIFYFRFTHTNWGIKDNYGVLSWDNFGYYLYLPATFIYHDPGIQKVDWVDAVREKYQPSPSFYQAHSSKNGKHVIQYTMGMAIFYIPAFFISHLFCLLTDYPADGFSIPYQFGILLYSFLWLCVGLMILRRFLLKYFDDWVVALSLFILVFGTNFFQLSTNNTSSPHIYLFTTYTALLLLTHVWYKKKKIRHLIILALIFGLHCLCRPNEALFLLIILLWNVKSKKDWNHRLGFLNKHKKEILKASLIVIGIGTFQIIYWTYTTGKPIFDSYPYEDFKLFSPYLWEYLFSYKKGWLLYTPIMIFSFLGYYFLYKRRREQFWGFFLFGILNIWILGSWDCWWYAGSFSQRSIVQSYPIYVFPLAYFVDFLKSKKQLGITIPVYAILIILIILNLFQSWQVKQNIIHISRMSEAYYWKVFGSTEWDEELDSLLEIDRSINYFPEPFPENHRLHYFNDFEDAKNGNRDTIEIDSLRFPSDQFLRLNAQNRNSEKVIFTFSELSQSSEFYYVVKLRYKSDLPLNESPFSVITEVKDYRSKKKYGWGNRHIEETEHLQTYKPSHWQTWIVIWVPPLMRSPKDSIFTHIEYRGNNELLIDDFSIEILDDLPLENENKWFAQNYGGLSVGDWQSSGKIISEFDYNLINYKNPYSTTLYIDSLQNLSNSLAKVSVQLYNPNSSKASLIMSIENNTAQLIYKSVPIRIDTQWQQIEEHFILNSKYPPESELKFYLWNPDPSPMLIDEFELRFENLAAQKE